MNMWQIAEQIEINTNEPIGTRLVHTVLAWLMSVMLRKRLYFIRRRGIRGKTK